MQSAGYRTRVVGAVLLLLSMLPSLAPGQALPPVNLGFTTFLDGAPPAGPGLYFQEYVQYYTAGIFRDQDGDRVPLLDSLDLWISLNQLIYQSDWNLLLGAKPGLDLIVPLVGIDVDAGRIPVLQNGSSGGLGDIVIGPILQWDPIMGAKGPVFMHRLEFQNIVPTGNYDNDRILNPGSNFYSFNPYWAGTVFILPEWTATGRFHYLWNAKNQDPNKVQFANAGDTQAGQAFHFNYASEYEVLPKRLRLGVNGYYLKQFTNAQVDGDGVSNSREQVFAVGPGALYSFSPNDHLFFNAYFESQVENRTEGSRFNFRWTHKF